VHAQVCKRGDEELLRGGKNVCEEESFPTSRRTLDHNCRWLGVGELDPGGTQPWGLGEWVGEKKQVRSCLGCDGFRYYPLRGLDHGDIHAIGWLARIWHMARRNAVIMRGFAAHWHSRDLNIS